MKNGIEKIIREKKVSQLQLARETNISPSDINQIIRGKKYCFPGWKKRIASTLKVEVEEIFEE